MSRIQRRNPCVYAANKTIGLLVPDTGNPYYCQVLQGAEAEAQACGYDILLVNTALDPHREREAICGVLRCRVDGLLIILAFRDQVIEEVRNIVGRRNVVALIGEAATIDNRLDSVRSDHAWCCPADDGAPPHLDIVVSASCSVWRVRR